jgi:large subunit ribosomal protein L10
MKSREEKEKIVELLQDRFNESANFYLADMSQLSVNDTNTFRRRCYEEGIHVQVVKNNLIKKALENANITYESLHEIIAGPSSVMFADNINAPAKIIQEFRKKHDRPVLKGAYVEETLYVGDDQLETLAALKSREELIGDIVGILQSPMKNVVSALQSGGNKLSGILKTLEEREES